MHTASLRQNIFLCAAIFSSLIVDILLDSGLHRFKLSVYLLCHGPQMEEESALLVEEEVLHKGLEVGMDESRAFELDDCL